MMFSKESLGKLRAEIQKRLSEKRFLHTLSVADMALRLGECCLPDKSDMLYAAGLLHDVTKELTYSEQLGIIKDFGIELDGEDIASVGVIHSFTAPAVIKRDFPEFATDEILSAVFKHTVGSPLMSVFDEIIFLADFIEEGRSYDASIRVRAYVFDSMSRGDINNNLRVLHTACVDEIDSTLIHLIKNKKQINSKNILTRNALLSKI